MIGIDDILIAIGLSSFGNLSNESIRKGIDRIKVGGKLKTKKLIIKSFKKAIQEHDKHYDDYAKERLKKLKKEINKTPNIIIQIFEEKGINKLPIFLQFIEKDYFKKELATKIYYRGF